MITLELVKVTSNRRRCLWVKIPRRPGGSSMRAKRRELNFRRKKVLWTMNKIHDFAHEYDFDLGDELESLLAAELLK